MTKAKKVLSLVLAVVMVAATFAFSASAANGKNATFTVSVDNATVSKGDVIKVTVNLTTDYYAGPTNVPVYYNPAFFEFDAGSVEGANIFGEGATDVQSYNDADTGCLRVAFIPQTSGGAASAKLNGTLFTFQLKAIANGTSEIGLHPVDQKTETNIGGPLYCGAYTSSAIDKNPATVGQTFTIQNATATVGSAMEVKLVGKTGTVAGETSTGIVDEAKHYIYGIVPGGNIEDFFEMSDGSALVIGLGTAEAMNGTGATVTVGEKVYTLVVFGDVSGDGKITVADKTPVSICVLAGNTNTLNAAAAFAADVTADGVVTVADKTPIALTILGNTTAISQNPYAA